MMDTSIIQKRIDKKCKKSIEDYTNIIFNLENGDEESKYIKLLKEYSNECFNLHFRGIHFLINILELEVESFYFQVINYNPNEKVKFDGNGILESQDLVYFLNFAISDVRSIPNLGLYLVALNQPELLIKTTDKSDLCLIFKKNSNIASKVIKIEKKFPLLLHKNV